MLSIADIQVNDVGPSSLLTFLAPPDRSSIAQQLVDKGCQASPSVMLSKSVAPVMMRVTQTAESTQTAGAQNDADPRSSNVVKKRQAGP